MKYFLMLLLTGLSLYASAQGGGPDRNSNSLLNQSFWQAKPGIEAVKAEIEKGNSATQMTSNAFDATMMAINAGAPNETIIYLLEQKGNEHYKLLHDGRTYIFIAASRGNMEIMQYLFGKGAKVDIQDSHGYSPLNFAATTGQQNTQVYDLIMKQGAVLKNTNHDGANALLLAVGADTSFQLTPYFQSKGLDIKSKDNDGNTAFDYAARSGNIKAMKLLLEKGVKTGGNAMLMAAQAGRRGGNSIEVFQYLESVQVKPNAISKTGDNALHSIVRRPGQTAIINYFLSRGLPVNQVNEEGNTVFMNAAASNRDTATLALLLPLTKDINLQNKAGSSALALAVRNNSPEIVAYLLNHGANINTTDAKGNNLVYYLIDAYSARQAKEFTAKLNLLKEKGLNMTAPQQDGSTIYHLAVAKNDLSFLKMIKDDAVDVNAKNKEGLTALHKAAMIAKDAAIMEYFISIGAKKDIKTSFDESAYELARENELLSKQKIAIDFLK